MEVDEKQSVTEDVKAAYAKTHFLLDDNQQLKVFVSKNFMYSNNDLMCSLWVYTYHIELGY